MKDRLYSVKVDRNDRLLFSAIIMAVSNILSQVDVSYKYQIINFDIISIFFLVIFLTWVNHGKIT